MNRLSSFFASIIHKTKSCERSKSKGNVSKLTRLRLESLDERCLPSASPLTLASNHDLSHEPAIVAVHAETKLVFQNVTVESTSSEQRKHDPDLEQRKHDPDLVQRKHDPDLEQRKHDGTV
jgi:hypothetical protein